MSRPTTMKVDGTVYWTINTYTDAGVLVDADSTPIVDIRKNGSPVLDVASSSKRSGATGVYDYSYNPASEAEGDTFTIEETATISSQSYRNTWSFKVLDAERGTDGANTVTPVGVSAIWNEPSASYATGGTFGNLLKNNPDADQVADAVWNEQQSEHTFNGSFGDYLDVRLSDSLEENMGYYVWDHLVANSNTAGSQGERVKNLNDFDPAADVVANVTLVDTTTDLTNGGSGGGGDATLANQNTILANQATILADTNELQTNQGDWATATTTVSSNMRGTDSALLASAAPSNWSILAINGSGEITTSNPASGGGSAHTAQDVANLILAVPTTPLANTVTGSLSLVDTTTNLTNGGSGGDDAATIYAYFTAGSNEDAFKADVSALALESTVQGISADVAALDVLLTTVVVVNQVALGIDIGNILDDTNELQGNQGDWATATGFATPADVTTSQGVVTAAISSLNDFDPASDVVARVTLVDTTTNLTNGGGGGDCPTAQEIVDAWGNQDQSVYVTQGTLGYYLDAQVSSAGSGGTGLYQATVRVQDSNNDALQGARINVDGTTLTLTTGSSGEVTFNLDSGVYLLEVSPPAGYDTPVGQVLTINTSDPAQTTFTLTSTTGPSGCTPPWIG